MKIDTRITPAVLVADRFRAHAHLSGTRPDGANAPGAAVIPLFLSGSFPVQLERRPPESVARGK